MNFLKDLFRPVCYFGLPMTPAAISAEQANIYRLTDGRLVSKLEIFQECEHCPDMIVMPKGSFMMEAELEWSTTCTYAGIMTHPKRRPLVSRASTVSMRLLSILQFSV